MAKKQSKVLKILLTTWWYYIYPIVGLCLFVASLPFLLPIFWMFRVYRNWMIHHINNFTPESVTVMDHNDAIWCQNTNENQGVINTLMWIKGELDINQWRKRITDILLHAQDEYTGKPKFPKFISRVQYVWHRYVWVRMSEEQMDICDHVWVHEGDRPKSQSELATLIGQICSKPLPADKPLWQQIVIPIHEEAGENGEKCVILFKVHHSIGDGISLTRFLLGNVIDEEPEPSKTEEPKRAAKSGMAAKILKAVLTGPALQIGKMFWPFDRHALHGPSLSGDKLVAWSGHIKLDLIKKIKNTSNSTVNDVLMSCLAGTFRDYMIGHSSNVPKTVFASVPVDIRSKTDRMELSNKFAIVFLPLPLDKETPTECLIETKSRMDDIKVSAEPVVNAATLTYMMSRLPSAMSRKFFNYITDKCSMVVSNVPGPQFAVHIMGSDVTSMIFWPPGRSRVGLSVSILSYNGHVKMGVIVDKNILSNPTILVELFETRLSALAEELGVDEN